MATQPLNIIFNAGYQESFLIDPAVMTGDPVADSQSAFFLSLEAGKLVATDSNGYVKLADGADDYGLGIVIVNGSGYAYENLPTAASGRIAALCGKAKIETTQVVETNVVPGDLLYIGTGANAGLFTTVASTTAQVVGVARSANSAANKTIEVTLL